MSRKTAARRRPTPTAPLSKFWTPQEVRTLRQLAGEQPRVRIARALRRSPAAVTFKAFELRLSLRVRDRSRRTAAPSARARAAATSVARSRPGTSMARPAAARRKLR
jgi:hypothetical protein